MGALYRPPASATSGYTSGGKQGQLAIYNGMLRDYAAANPGTIFVDLAAATMDTLAATYSTASNRFRDATVHENNVGGWYEGKALAAVISDIVPARQGLLPSSSAATSALDASIPRLHANPLMTGSVAVVSTGSFVTGNAPTGVAGVLNWARSGSATAVASVVTRADGRGQDLNLACTFTAAGETLELRLSTLHVQAVVGGTYIAVAEVSYSGAAGAALTTADNLRGVQLYLQYNDGKNYFTYDWGTNTTDGALPESATGVLMKTLPLTIPAGTPATFRPNITITAHGAGTPRVRIGLVDLIRVA